MGNVNVNYGFPPWGVVKRSRLYAVQTAPVINIAVGDMVQADNAGLVSPKLGMGIILQDAVIISATPGDEYPLLGSVLACFDENMDPITYIAATRAGDATVAGYVLVADHPEQEFHANVDAALAAADIDLFYSIASETISAPNSTTYISTQRITVSGAATTTTIPMRLYSQVFPGVDVYSAAGCRMICRIQPACHYYGISTAL